MTIDKAEIQCRFKRSLESYEENAHAQKAIIRQLMALLEIYCPLSYERILEIGCGTGLLTVPIQQRFKDSDLFINDLVDAMCSKAASRCGLSTDQCIVGDIEQVPLNGKFDLIISASTFQWLASPAATFKRLAQHLQEGGWLVFSTFGKENYKELKTITGKGLIYRSTQEMIELLSGNYKIIYAGENKEVLQFNDPLEILKHVKKTGVNATDLPHTWTRGSLLDFTCKYKEYFGKDGNYPLTYHPQYFLCQKLAAR